MGQTVPVSASFFAKASRRAVSWMATGSVDVSGIGLGMGVGIGVGVVWARRGTAVRVRMARMERNGFMGVVAADFVLHDTTGFV